MGVKYRVNYKDEYNQSCRVDISLASYNDVPIILRAQQGNACVIDYDCPDDPYEEPIVNSKAVFNLYQLETSPIDILEIQKSQYRDFTASLFIEDALKWTGYIDPAGIQRIFQAPPFVVSITAVDGLKLLDGVDYTHDNLTGGRIILNYLRQILFDEHNLGLPLPIRWVNTLVNEEYPLEDDVFSGSVEWAPRGEGFTDYNGNVKSNLYILEEMIRSMQSRIYQADGRWMIERINDIVTGEYIYRETPGVLTGLDIYTSPPQFAVKTIGSSSPGFNYRFIEEDAVQTVLPGLKRVITTYNQDQRDNVLPNGSMDLVSSFTNTPLYWELTGFVGSSYMESVPSIYEDRGNAVKVVSDASIGKRLDLIGELPIDTDVLYETMNIGFKFLPVSGFTVDGDGIIDWVASQRFFYQVAFYDNDGTVFYLNEFGFWVRDFTFMLIEVPNLKLGDVAQVDFNKFQNIPLVIPANVPIDRQTPPSLKISFSFSGSCEVILDDVYIKLENNSDVYRATVENTRNSGVGEYTMKISSSHNGFYVSNYMTGYAMSGLEKFFSDSRYTGTLTAMTSHAILRNRYLASLLMDLSIYAPSWRYGEIYNIQTLAGINFLPLKASWNTETNTTTLTCVEIRNDDVDLLVEHYGKNDDIGSN